MATNKEQLFSCAICLDVASEPVVTQCGHLFCWPCLEQWLYSGVDTFDCPVCKSFVSPNIPGLIIPLYGTSRDDKSERKTFANSSQEEPNPSTASTRARTTQHAGSSSSSSRPPPSRESHAFQQRRPAATNVPGPRQNGMRWSTIRNGSLGVQVFCMTCFSSIGIFLTLFFLFVLPWLQSTGIRGVREWWRNFRHRRGVQEGQRSSNETSRGQAVGTNAFWALPAPLMDPFFCSSCVLFAVSVIFLFFLLI